MDKRLVGDIIKRGCMGGEGVEVKGGRMRGMVGEKGTPKKLGIMNKLVAKRSTLRGDE